MKPFKCIKQLILQSGIYVLFSSGLFHILIANMSQVSSMSIEC